MLYCDIKVEGYLYVTHRRSILLDIAGVVIFLNMRMLDQVHEVTHIIRLFGSVLLQCVRLFKNLISCIFSYFQLFICISNKTVDRPISLIGAKRTDTSPPGTTEAVAL